MKRKQPNEKRIAALVKELIAELGEDPKRDGLVKTPERVAKSLTFLTRGYRQNLRAVVNGAKFASGTNHMVILKDIELYSLCEHHMLPFFGKAHVARSATSRRGRCSASPSSRASSTCTRGGCRSRSG